MVRHMGEEEMSVAKHLHIEVAEHDARIRTFVPGYERMMAAEAMRLVEGESLEAEGARLTCSAATASRCNGSGRPARWA